MAYDALSPEATGIPKKAEEGNTTMNFQKMIRYSCEYPAFLLKLRAHLP
jgi:hypothetical protein